MKRGEKKYVLWIEDEQFFETARIRKLRKELGKNGYNLKLFEKPNELYKFLEDKKDKVVGIIIDLMLPATAEDFDILGGKYMSFEVGLKLANVVCKQFNKPIIILTNLTRTSSIGQKIWDQLDRGDNYCIKEKLQKSETTMKDFIEKIKNLLQI